MVLDVNLPDGFGFDLALQLQGKRDVAVIYTSCRASTAERPLGLENGGDDYLVKPLDPRELLARIRVVLRRYGQPAALARERVITIGGWILDLVGVS